GCNERCVLVRHEVETRAHRWIERADPAGAVERLPRERLGLRGRAAQLTALSLNDEHAPLGIPVEYSADVLEEPRRPDRIVVSKEDETPFERPVPVAVAIVRDQHHVAIAAAMESHRSRWERQLDPSERALFSRPLRERERLEEVLAFRLSALRAHEPNEI